MCPCSDSKKLANYMAPRLFWFLAGGASAFWFVKHHDRMHQQWDQQRVAGDDTQQWGWGSKRGSERDCMKYSWYHGSRHRPDSPQATADREEIRAEIDDVAEAKQRLMASVKTGIRNVMDALVSIEATFNEERADLQRRRQEAAVRSAAPAPEPAPTSAPPQTTSNMSERAPTVVPPKYTPENKDQVTMSQILVALENINSKLGNSAGPSTAPKGPSPASGETPRLV